MENNDCENIGLLTLLPVNLLTSTKCNAAASANDRILTKLYHIFLDSLLIVDLIDRLNKLGLGCAKLSSAFFNCQLTRGQLVTN